MRFYNEDHAREIRETAEPNSQLADEAQEYLDAHEKAVLLGKKQCKFVKSGPGYFVCPQCEMGQNRFETTDDGKRQCSNAGCNYIEGQQPDRKKVTCYIV